MPIKNSSEEAAESGSNADLPIQESSFLPKDDTFESEMLAASEDDLNFPLIYADNDRITFVHTMSRERFRKVATDLLRQMDREDKFRLEKANLANGSNESPSSSLKSCNNCELGTGKDAVDSIGKPLISDKTFSETVSVNSREKNGDQIQEMSPESYELDIEFKQRVDRRIADLKNQSLNRSFHELTLGSASSLEDRKWKRNQRMSLPAEMLKGNFLENIAHGTDADNSELIHASFREGSESSLDGHTEENYSESANLRNLNSDENEAEDGKNAANDSGKALPSDVHQAHLISECEKPSLVSDDADENVSPKTDEITEDSKITFAKAREFWQNSHSLNKSMDSTEIGESEQIKENGRRQTVSEGETCNESTVEEKDGIVGPVEDVHEDSSEVSHSEENPSELTRDLTDVKDVQDVHEDSSEVSHSVENPHELTDLTDVKDVKDVENSPKIANPKSTEGNLSFKHVADYVDLENESSSEPIVNNDMETSSLENAVIEENSDQMSEEAANTCEELHDDEECVSSGKDNETSIMSPEKSKENVEHSSEEADEKNSSDDVYKDGERSEVVGDESTSLEECESAIPTAIDYNEANGENGFQHKVTPDKVSCVIEEIITEVEVTPKVVLGDGESVLPDIVAETMGSGSLEEDSKCADEAILQCSSADDSTSVVVEEPVSNGSQKIEEHNKEHNLPMSDPESAGDEKNDKDECPEVVEQSDDSRSVEGSLESEDSEAETLKSAARKTRSRNGTDEIDAAPTRRKRNVLSGLTQQAIPEDSILSKSIGNSGSIPSGSKTSNRPEKLSATTRALRSRSMEFSPKKCGTPLQETKTKNLSAQTDSSASSRLRRSKTPEVKLKSEIKVAVRNSPRKLTRAAASSSTESSPATTRVRTSKNQSSSNADTGAQSVGARRTKRGA